MADVRIRSFGTCAESVSCRKHCAMNLVKAMIPWAACPPLPARQLGGNRAPVSSPLKPNVSGIRARGADRLENGHAARGAHTPRRTPSLNPLAFNLEKCDELRAFDTHVFGSTTYNRHTGVPRLPGPGPGVHRNFFPNRAGVPLSNGLEIRSLIEHSLLCPTLHRCSQAELEAHIAGVAVCNSHAAQAAWL